MNFIDVERRIERMAGFYRGARGSQVHMRVSKLFASPPRDQPILLPLLSGIFDTIQFYFNISPVLSTAGERDKERTPGEKSRRAGTNTSDGECNDEPKSTKTRGKTRFAIKKWKGSNIDEPSISGISLASANAKKTRQ